MAEDSTEQKPEDQAPTDEDKAAAIAAARELLIAEGHQVVDGKQIKAAKDKARRPLEAELNATKEQLAALEAERNELAQFKQAQDDEGKTATQLHEQQKAEWKRRDEEAKAELEALKTQVQAERDARKAIALKTQLGDLLTNLAPHVDPAAIRDYAVKQLPGLDVNEAGVLTYTDTAGLDHEGAAAAEHVTRWWNSPAGKTFQAANPPGPPTAGSPSAPPPQDNSYDPRKYTDLKASMLAAERADREAGIRR